MPDLLRAEDRGRMREMSAHGTLPLAAFESVPVDKLWVQEIQSNPTNEMREIKFRAWDNFNKRMLGPFGPFRWHDEYDLLYLEGTLDVPAGDNLNFMQFTGLTDKNGKEIYEGDVLKYFNPATKTTSLHSIVWQDRKGRFGMQALTGARRNEEPRPMTQREAHFDRKSEFEVIGNIYENPDKLDPSNPSFN
jgi:uncharacterized phage protein (TIGR01671 family)